MSAQRVGRTAELPSVRTASPAETTGSTAVPATDPVQPDPVQAHLAAGEELARLGCWEDAYRQLRAAVGLLEVGVDYRPPARAELDQLRREHAMARELAKRDSLTASYNRRYLDDRLASLLHDPAVTAVGMALAMVDIDHFKQVNDRWGHPFGDRVLQRVVTELDAALPEGAFCARYGGEEFALVLPGRDPDEAIAVCERARTRIERHHWFDLAPALRVTVSIGVSHSVETPPDVEQLLIGADVLLYAAKGAGRNAVAFRDGVGAVALAGPAGARRDIPQPALFD